MNEESISNDIFECINISITDKVLSKSKIAAYMFNQSFTNLEDKEKPFTPKAFPGKAIIIRVPIDDKHWVEIYLDAEEKVWDSKIVVDGQLKKLSPDQMQQFFESDFYKKMTDSIADKWPMSDPTYNELFAAVVGKSLRIGRIPEDELNEIMSNLNDADQLLLGNTQLTELEHRHDKNQPNKNVKLANKDITGDGARDYTGSGRRIVHFGNNGLKTSSAKFLCWPRLGKEFKWNTWKDWTKIRPFCKMKFQYNGREYMIALTKLVDEQFDNRGFRGGDLEWKPPFGWLSQEEVHDILGLSLTQKFIRQCKKRVMFYASMKSEDVFKQIDKPERITIKEIEKTQRVLKHMVQQMLNDPHEDNYKYDK